MQRAIYYNTDSRSFLNSTKFPMSKKEHPTELDKSSAVHDEHADTNALALLSSEVKYDAGKLSDLIHNPYAFGAAFLASFGGFSFGYGRSFV